jgi:uncharacterized protein (TIGR02266 family)
MSKKKILLVDDVKLFLELEKTFFRRDEFELLVAHNGREALALIGEQKPDLIFLDLHMPEMNGDECCRRIKSEQETRHIPVIMVTQSGSDENLELCHRAGCDDIVLKPINRHQIVATTRKFLLVADRQEPRFLARLHVKYGSSPERTLTNFSINLSTGGLFLETASPLPVHTPLSVEFKIPANESSIKCRAKVAWVNNPEFMKNLSLPGGMGIQFIDLTIDEMNSIRAYLKNDALSPFW